MGYVDQLTDRDLEILAARQRLGPAELRSQLSTRPWMLADLASDSELLDDLLDPRTPLEECSPFLIFAAAVFRSAFELRTAGWVSEWTGPRQRLPVLSVEPLCEFLDDPARGLFLATLLAGFVKADQLDPRPVAALVAGAGPARRVLLRRLGDLALFRAGVLPDYTGSHPLAPRDADLLGQSAGLRAGEVLSLLAHPSAAGLEPMEVLGARWYRLAFEAGDPSPVVADVANRFSAGRRVLTHLSDRYLWKINPSWLPLTA